MNPGRVPGTCAGSGRLVRLPPPARRREFPETRPRDAARSASSGELLQSGRDLLSQVAAVLFACASGSMCRLILFQAHLVPLWLSSWGIGGAALAGAASLPLFSRAVPDHQDTMEKLPLGAARTTASG